MPTTAAKRRRPEATSTAPGLRPQSPLCTCSKPSVTSPPTHLLSNNCRLSSSLAPEIQLLPRLKSASQHHHHHQLLLLLLNSSRSRSRRPSKECNSRCHHRCRISNKFLPSNSNNHHFPLLPRSPSSLCRTILTSTSSSTRTRTSSNKRHQ